LNKDFVLVNTHIPYAGEITATDLFLPYDQIGQQLEQLPTDKQAKIVLYCRTGHMSAIAAETLVKAGYTNVWDVEGGMVAWQKSGQSIISK
jgi:rhodanese-related sulfurtransferase